MTGKIKDSLLFGALRSQKTRQIINRNLEPYMWSAPRGGISSAAADGREEGEEGAASQHNADAWKKREQPSRSWGHRQKCVTFVNNRREGGTGKAWGGFAIQAGTKWVVQPWGSENYRGRSNTKAKQVFTVLDEQRIPGKRGRHENGKSSLT